MKNGLQYLNEILKLLGKDRRKLPVLVLFFLLASFLDLAGLGLIAPYITLVINPDKVVSTDLFNNLVNVLGIDLDWESMVLAIGLVMVLIFFFKVIGNLWIQYNIASFSHRQQIRLRSYLMQAYQNLPYHVYLRRNSSEYVYSVQNLVPNYGGVLSVILRTLSDGMIAFVIILLLAWQNFLILLLLLFLLGGLVLIYDRVFRKRLREFGERNNDANQQMLKSINEAIEGLKELRILGKEDYFHRRLKEGAKRTAYFSIRQQLLSLAPGFLLEFLLVTFVVFILSVVVLQGETLKDIIPTIGVFGVAALRLKPTANSLASSLISLRFERDSIRRLFKDVRYVESLDSPINPPRFVVNTNVSFNELALIKSSFCYPGMSQPALKEVSIRIQKGETIGLIGPSGSGKTTMVDVLLGLLEPQSGALKYNGLAFKEALNEWCSQVAYLPQEVFLIDNTLKHNVAMGEEDKEINKHRLKEALRLARLTELVEQLPQGVNTLLGERGVRLSGGQRQRVALARAFYNGRNVLVMDEATSSLDDATEKEIVEEIKHLKGQKTMIVIAHRLSTVQHCDRIYRLEKGKIVEEGPPEKVLFRAS